MKQRQEQLASVLTRVLAEHLRSHSYALDFDSNSQLPQESNSVFLNINYVTISKRVDFADVYITLFDPNKDNNCERAVHALNTHSSVIGQRICAQLNWRKMPQLRFHTDQSAAHARRMERVLDALHKK